MEPRTPRLEGRGEAGWSRRPRRSASACSARTRLQSSSSTSGSPAGRSASKPTSTRRPTASSSRRHSRRTARSRVRADAVLVAPTTADLISRSCAEDAELRCQGGAQAVDTLWEALERIVGRPNRTARVRRARRDTARAPSGSVPGQPALSLVRELNARLGGRRIDVLLVDSERLAARIGKQRWSDPGSGTPHASLRVRRAAVLARETAAVLAGGPRACRALPRRRPRQHALGRDRRRRGAGGRSSLGEGPRARHTQRSRSIFVRCAGRGVLLAVASKNDRRRRARAVRAQPER